MTLPSLSSIRPLPRAAFSEILMRASGLALMHFSDEGLVGRGVVEAVGPPRVPPGELPRARPVADEDAVLLEVVPVLVIVPVVRCGLGAARARRSRQVGPRAGCDCRADRQKGGDAGERSRIPQISLPAAPLR